MSITYALMMSGVGIDLERDCILIIEKLDMG